MCDPVMREALVPISPRPHRLRTTRSSHPFPNYIALKARSYVHFSVVTSPHTWTNPAQYRRKQNNHAPPSNQQNCSTAEAKQNLGIDTTVHDLLHTPCLHAFAPSRCSHALAYSHTYGRTMLSAGPVLIYNPTLPNRGSLRIQLDLTRIRAPPC